MASKAMADRLAAKASAAAGGSAEGVAQGETVGGLDADAGDDVSAVQAVSEDVGEAASPAADEQASGTASTAETPEQVEAKARAKRLELFEEKLKDARERRHAARALERAKAERKAAAAEREATAAEKAKWEKIGKEGTYLDGLKALGRDPRAEWEAMNKEAIEAGTPEAQARREREALQRELDAKLTPMQREIEQLRAEREQLRAQQEHHRLTSSFSNALADPAFSDLRVEYSDAELLDTVRTLIRTPESVAVLHEAAQRHGVQLTNPEKGFTMQEILRTLAAEQAAHDRGKQARKAAISPAGPQSAQPSVNGTAPRRNAGTAIGNELASQRASSGPVVSGSPKDRLRERIAAETRRSGG